MIHLLFGNRTESRKLTFSDIWKRGLDLRTRRDARGAEPE